MVDCGSVSGDGWAVSTAGGGFQISCADLTPFGPLCGGGGGGLWGGGEVQVKNPP